LGHVKFGKILPGSYVIALLPNDGLHEFGIGQFGRRSRVHFGQRASAVRFQGFCHGRAVLGMVAMQLGQPFVVSGHLAMMGSLDVVAFTRLVRGVFRVQLVQTVVLVGHGHVVLGCLREVLAEFVSHFKFLLLGWDSGGTVWKSRSAPLS